VGVAILPSVLLFIITLAIGGLVIGALGRLLVPGPNPMGLLRTILVGLAGSFLGGLVARLALGLRYRYSLGLAFAMSVLFAALIVYAFERRSPRRRF
jgi:uncharacterized membrane protein YeaQ/YmgE (transglycosylase-associated protein family)